MARVFDHLAVNRLTTSSAPTTSYPVTFAAWIKPRISKEGIVMSIMSTATSNDGFWIYQDANNLNKINTADAGNQATVSASIAGATNGVWNHVAGTYTNSPSHQGWLNGTASAEQTDTKTTFSNAPDSFAVGIKNNSVPANSNAYDGNISWPCIWDVKLTDAEIVSLSNGAHPYSVRPESIINFWGDLHGTGDESPTIGSLTLTETGTVTAAQSPLLPIGAVGMVRSGTGAAGGTAPLFLYHNRHHNRAA